METQSAEHSDQELADPLLEEIEALTPPGGRPIRPGEYSADSDRLDKAIREWLKHEGRCFEIVSQVLDGYSLVSTARPSPTSRYVSLATAIRGSICESIAKKLAINLLTTVHPWLPEDSSSRLDNYASALLLEFLPFDDLAELVLESVPAVHRIVLQSKLLNEDVDDEESHLAVRRYIQRRARTKLRIKSRRDKLDVRLSHDLSHIIEIGTPSSEIPLRILDFLKRLLEWLETHNSDEE